MTTLGLTLVLAWKDFRHEAGISACAVLGLAAVLAPLLVLFGLKFGMIDTMAQRLIEDPRNREILPVGSLRLDRAWFDSLRQRPEVAFLIAETRRLSASFNWLDAGSGRPQIEGVGMVATAAGDPLLAGGPEPQADTEIVLSAAAARKLGVAAGTEVGAVVIRHGVTDQSAQVTLRVAGVAAEAAQPGDVAFVTLGLLTAVEDFRDGFAVPRFGWDGDPRPDGERIYPQFRLYVRSIWDVVPFRAVLRGLAIETRSRAADIETLQSLDRTLSRVFWTVAGLGAAGLLASLSATLVAGVERKRRHLAVLRLLGLPAWSIVSLPAGQAALVAALGCIIASMAAQGIGTLLNRQFGENLRLGEAIFQLRPAHLAAAVAVTLITALAASIWSGARAARIDPAEGLRDV